MDRATDVLRGTLERIDAGRTFAVALILDAEGSTPRKRGVRAIIDVTGAIAGTVGGGLVEAEAQRRAVAAAVSGKPEILEVSLRGVDAGDESPVCGGTIRVLLDPTAAKDRAAYAAALEAIARRERGALVTTVGPGGGSAPSSAAVTLKTWVTWYGARAIPSDAPLPGSAALRECIARESAHHSGREGDIEAVAEPIIPEPRLLIVGGGHIGQALAALADELGYEVTVVDDRAEFTVASLYPERVARRCGDIPREVEAFPKDPETSIVIVTRGHRHDAAALAACVRSRAAYIGMIGSRRKVALLRAELMGAGLATAEELDRVFAPIGLDIGAVTVPEIATSIAAQLVCARRKGGVGGPVGRIL